MSLALNNMNTNAWKIIQNIKYLGVYLGPVYKKNSLKSKNLSLKKMLNVEKK